MAPVPGGGDARLLLIGIAPQFLDWLFGTMDTPRPDLADAALENVDRLVAALAAANPRFQLTAWRSEDVDNLLDEILPSGQLADSEAGRWRAAGQASMFLNFLVASGLWAGEPAQLAHCSSRLAQFLTVPPAVPTP